MSARCCQTAAKTPSWAQRSLHLAAWALPSVALALMPKCPLCVAGYVALATASYVRTLLVILCGGPLTYLVVRRVRGAVVRRRG